MIKNNMANKRLSLDQIPEKKLSRDQKVKYLRVALSLQKIGVSEETCDRIIETYERVLRLGGNFSLNDAINIELDMDYKYKNKELKNDN